MIDKINKKYFFLAVGSSNIGKNHDNDITVRCPICGDSTTKKHSARLHLYSKNNVDLVHCFNGGCALNEKNFTMHGFLKSFYPSLFDSYKSETSMNSLNKLLNKDAFDEIIEIKKNIPKEKPITTHNLFEYFSPIDKHMNALNYLGNRGYFYNEKHGKFYFGIQDLQIGDKLYKITNCIIIPLYFEDEMYGFYSRNITNKEFWTYMPEVNIGYKIFNWFNIDKDKEVYIFEGIFDALSSGLENVIALMGAKIPEDRLKELKKPIFVLDNDKTGLINSLSYSKRGYAVYVQPDKYKEKDMNEFMLNHKELNISDVIKQNIYSGIMAQVKIQQKL